MSRIRKSAALVSATALLGAGGLGVAQAATSGSSSAGKPPAGKRHGGGQLPATQLAAIAKALGVTSAQLKAALTASKPAKPAAGSAREDGRAAELATALGADVAKVREILDANRPAKPAGALQGAKPAGRPGDGTPPTGRPGAPGGRPDDAKLVAALATGLGIDEAKVTAAFATLEAAHEADHTTRETAMYAAVAKKLGVTADAVKAAFEANRPAKPARPAK